MDGALLTNSSAAVKKVGWFIKFLSNKNSLPPTWLYRSQSWENWVLWDDLTPLRQMVLGSESSSYPSLDDKKIAFAKDVFGQCNILWGLALSHVVTLSQTSFPLKPAPCSGSWSSFPCGIYGVTLSTTGKIKFSEGSSPSPTPCFPLFQSLYNMAAEIAQLEKCLPCKHEHMCLMPRGGDRKNTGAHSPVSTVKLESLVPVWQTLT